MQRSIRDFLDRNDTSNLPHIVGQSRILYESCLKASEFIDSKSSQFRYFETHNKIKEFYFNFSRKNEDESETNIDQ